MGRKIADSRNSSIRNFICGGQVDRIRFHKIVFHVRNVDCQRRECDLQSSLCVMCIKVFRFRRHSQSFFSWIFFLLTFFAEIHCSNELCDPARPRLMRENRDSSSNLGLGYNSTQSSGMIIAYRWTWNESSTGLEGNVRIPSECWHCAIEGRSGDEDSIIVGLWKESYFLSWDE